MHGQVIILSGLSCMVDVDVKTVGLSIAPAKLPSFDLSEDHTGAKAFDMGSGQS